MPNHKSNGNAHARSRTYTQTRAINRTEVCAALHITRDECACATTLFDIPSIFTISTISSNWTRRLASLALLIVHSAHVQRCVAEGDCMNELSRPLSGDLDLPSGDKARIHQSVRAVLETLAAASAAQHSEDEDPPLWNFNACAERDEVDGEACVQEDPVTDWGRLLEQLVPVTEELLSGLMP